MSTTATQSYGYIANRSPTGHAEATLVFRDGARWRLGSHPTDQDAQPPLVAETERVFATAGAAVVAARKRWKCVR